MKNPPPAKIGYYVPKELKQTLLRLMNKNESSNGRINWEELFVLNPWLFDCFPGKSKPQIHKYALDLRRKLKWTPADRARAVRVVQRWRRKTNWKRPQSIAIGSVTSGQLAKDLRLIRQELGMSISDVLRYGASRLLGRIKK